MTRFIEHGGFGQDGAITQRAEEQHEQGAEKQCDDSPAPPRHARAIVLRDQLATEAVLVGCVAGSLVWPREDSPFARGGRSLCEPLERLPAGRWEFESVPPDPPLGPPGCCGACACGASLGGLLSKGWVVA